MPLQATSGAASYDAFGGGVAAVPTYIEDVFSTWLYTGNGSTQTITNGIDLAGKGGLVWSKARSTSLSNFLCDTVRGRAFYLYSNNTFNQAGPSSAGNDITAFNSNGYSLGPNQNADINNGSATFVSWTFREQPKFFDVVTYTGNGVAGRAIPHNLGSVPGCIIVKRTDSSASWYVYHRGVDATRPQDYVLLLDQTLARIDSSAPWNDTAPTATDFTVGDNSNYNGSGATYVAYLFAHNAGGFGLTGTDNVISCGSFVANTTVDLGYEPQWVMLKNASATGGWYMFDNMRGMPTPADAATLFANLSAAEGQQALIAPTSTGFTVSSLPAGNTFIYIAIRRGPMKVPTTGTSVFAPVALTPSSTQIVTTGFPTDWTVLAQRSRAASGNTFSHSRLQGGSEDPDSIVRLSTNTTNAENTSTSGGFSFQNNTGIIDSYYNQIQGFDSSTIYWNFRRAPGFFDEVCYTGTGVARTVAHNLGVAPELMIVKQRNSTNNWPVYVAPLDGTRRLMLNFTDAVVTDSIFWNDTNPTSSVFTVGTASSTNASGSTYVAYLFASCPGVSKVGSFTGTGATQVINCGFTTGARFVLIKATSTTGNWLVWDSARGIVAGNDPYLALNSTAAEVTNTDWVDTAASGFELSNAGGNLANSNGVSYIFWAVA